MNVTGIIVAAGSGRRMKASKNKIFLKFGGTSALARCIRVHRDSGCFTSLIVVCRKEDEKGVADALRRNAGGVPWRIVHGGTERQDSVCNALAAVDAGSTELVSIHDAARCFVTEKLIKACVGCAEIYGSAVPVSAVTDTVKSVDGDVITGTLNRRELRLVQTPQVFRTDILIDAYEKAYRDGFYGTDDAMLLERNGISVHTVSGDDDNIKITTRSDIDKGRSIAGAEMGFKIGNGFDVHAFKEGRKLVLGGVEFPGETGLDGHSDADVVIHAVMDALLGAAGLPDIGELFPPGAARYKDISSMILLGRVREKLDERFCRVVNIDVTVMMQRPKIAPVKDRMAANIADVLGIDHGCVSIKGTTTEHLGFVGRQEGVCANAVCLVKM